mgnify:CR=1 FL=1
MKAKEIREMSSEELENKLKELKIKVKTRPVEIGYEVRCQTPIAYDLVYCSELGMGVYKLFSEGTPASHLPPQISLLSTPAASSSVE